MRASRIGDCPAETELPEVEACRRCEASGRDEYDIVADSGRLYLGAVVVK